MANLGSEVYRFLSYLKENNKKYSETSYKEIKKIIKDLSDFPEMKRRKIEIKILEKILRDFKKKKKEFSVKPEQLNSYFLPFASLILK